MSAGLEFLKSAPSLPSSNTPFPLPNHTPSRPFPSPSVGQDKNENLVTAERVVEDAVTRGAGLVVLPECFNRCVILYGQCT